MSDTCQYRTELDPELYNVVWFAPLEIEAQAASSMLDHKHRGSFALSPGDDYVFQAGDICGHNVIIATFPAGQEYGTGSAAALASQVKKFFPNIWFGLLVGVAAGLPDLCQTPPLDIRLGDVLVGLPLGERPGHIAYDLGKETDSDGFHLLRSGRVLANTATIVRSAIGAIKSKEPNSTNTFLPYYERMKHMRHTNGFFLDPGQEHDQLYQVDDDGVEQLIEREKRPDSQRTRVWYGTIGSGDKLMRSGRKGRELRDSYGIIGLEMEAAGIMNLIPVGVIRGVCDYGDRHKNKEWQPYAAALAAAYAKAVLYEILPKSVRAQQASRTYDITDEDDRCLADLLLTDPRDDKIRIERTKGGLLNDSFCWVLDNPEFQKWQNHEQSRLLWIKGDAGKGKTMLLIGIINELSQQMGRPGLHKRALSYYLCQGTDSRLNNATAILRGLIYLLGIQQPFLISYLRKKYNHSGRRLFEDPGAFYSLCEVFQHVLQDSRLTMTYLIVDALDECEVQLPEILDLIAWSTSECARVKWLVSSRNRYDIEQWLGNDDSHTRLSLELNAKHVSQAINVYIEHKISKIAALKHDQELQEQVCAQLQQKSDGTFLWVALVIQELREVLPGDTLEVLEEIPSGLTPLYDRMIEQIKNLRRSYPQRCFLTLSIAALAYRPLHLLEMRVLAGLQNEIMRPRDLEGIIGMCGSLLTVRDNYVYFIHQSAKEYLTLTTDVSSMIFPAGPGQTHYNMFLRSLDALSNTLQRDIYNLQGPGPMTRDASPDPDPLAPIRYSALFWCDHLCEVDHQNLGSTDALSGNPDAVIFKFLNQHFLHWLESLSLIREISSGVLIVRKLIKRVQSVNSPQFAIFLKDSERFILSYRSIIAQAPLQTYGAALTFCPEKSKIKTHYWEKRLPFIKDIAGIRESWDPCLQILEGHQNWVWDVAFSHDGKMLASVSSDHTVRLWDASTGVWKKKLKGHKDSVWAVAFSLDGQILASGSRDHTITLWDITNEVWKQTLRGHTDSVWDVTFSSDSQILASASSDHTIRLWNATTGSWKQTLRGHTDSVWSVAFSPDSQILASASSDHTIRLWNATTGSWKKNLEGHTDSVWSVAFSPDGQTLASASSDWTIQLWDVTHGIRKQVIRGHDHWVRDVTFSPDGQTLASASNDHTVRLWDGATGVCTHTFKGHKDSVFAVAFSPDSEALASASSDHTIRLWETSKTCNQEPIGHTDWVWDITFTPDGRTLASASSDHTICLWDASAKVLRQTLQGHKNWVRAVAFSWDGETLASASSDRIVQLWDMTTASGGNKMSPPRSPGVQLWDVNTAAWKKKLEVSRAVTSLSFSTDGQHLQTDRGLLILSSGSPNMSTNQDKLAYTICVDGEWVTRNGQNILWLPPDYRPTCVAVHNNLLVLGLSSGQVVFLEFAL